MADIPGLIEGAAEGAGLGHQFLRHLQRTRLLLHVIDAAPFDDGVDPVKEAKALAKELEKYDPELAAKPRWLVLNKLDMVPTEDRAARCKDIVKRLKWKGPVFEISALAREGLQPMLHAIYEHVHAQVEQPAPPVDPRFEETLPVVAPVVDEPVRPVRAAEEGRQGRARPTTTSRSIRASRRSSPSPSSRPPRPPRPSGAAPAPHDRAAQRPPRPTPPRSTTNCATRAASSSRSAPAWSPTKAAASMPRPSATGAARWPRSASPAARS